MYFQLILEQRRRESLPDTAKRRVDNDSSLPCKYNIASSLDVSTSSIEIAIWPSEGYLKGGRRNVAGAESKQSVLVCNWS